jgi:hypothetical protein
MKVVLGVLAIVAVAEYLLGNTETNKRPTKELGWFLFDFAQWVNVLFLLRFKWPVGVLNLFQGLMIGLDVAETLTVGCVFEFSYYERLAFTVSSVVVYPLIFMLYTVLKYCVFRATGGTDQGIWEWFLEKNYNRSFPKAFTFIFTYVSPNIITTCLKHFQCIAVYDQEFMRSRLEIACYSDQWWSWSVVAILGMIVVAVPPLIMLVVLYRALRSLEHEDRDAPSEWSREQFDDCLSHWTTSFQPGAWYGRELLRHLVISLFLTLFFSILAPLRMMLLPHF